MLHGDRMTDDERKAAHAQAKIEAHEARELTAQIMIERRAEPALTTSAKVVSDEEREIAFLLSYSGDDEGLLWRKANTERELAHRQATVERKEQEVRSVLSRYQAQRTNANTGVNKMIADECFKVAHGVGQQLGEVAEGLQKQLAELRVDVRIATKRAELAELHAEIAKAAPTQGNELFYLDDAGNRRDAELHERILGPREPINEAMMKPIRDKRRQQWLADQRTMRGQRRA